MFFFKFSLIFVTKREVWPQFLVEMNPINPVRVVQLLNDKLEKQQYTQITGHGRDDYEFAETLFNIIKNKFDSCQSGHSGDSTTSNLKRDQKDDQKKNAENIPGSVTESSGSEYDPDLPSEMTRSGRRKEISEDTRKKIVECVLVKRNSIRATSRKFRKNEHAIRRIISKAKLEHGGEQRKGIAKPGTNPRK